MKLNNLTIGPRLVTTAAAKAAGSTASEVLSNARALDNQSGMLRSAVEGFPAKVRAA